MISLRPLLEALAAVRFLKHLHVDLVGHPITEEVDVEALLGSVDPGVAQTVLVLEVGNVLPDLLLDIAVVVEHRHVVAAVPGVPWIHHA